MIDLVHLGEPGANPSWWAMGAPAPTNSSNDAHSGTVLESGP